MLRSSKEAIDLIIEEEISSRAVYEKKYIHPEWPGGASGITIGIGYDIGYATPSKIVSDWGSVLSADAVDLLVKYSGLKGQDAKNNLWKVKNIIVPYDAAYKVFCKDLESYEYQVNKLPNSQELSPDSFGALTSLVYNRGASFNKDGDRYREMRNVKNYLATKQFSKIPGEINGMGRLWAGTELTGLVRRREREARLFEKGLASVNSESTPVTEINIEEGNETPTAGGPFSWIKNWLWFK